MINQVLVSADALRIVLRNLNDQLDTALKTYSTFEYKLNAELKVAQAPEERDAIFARRAQYEDMLGIEALVNHIDTVRQQLHAYNQ